MCSSSNRGCWDRESSHEQRAGMPRRGLHHLLGYCRAGDDRAPARRRARDRRHRPGRGGGQRRAGQRRRRGHDPRARPGSNRGRGEMTGMGPDEPGAGSIESLYPFLYAGTTDLPAVISELDGARLTSCAADAAARFAAGGRLLAFGNGGSATDAQQLATLFLNPGGDARPLPALGLAADTSVVTALCNDIGVDVVFARQIAAFGRRNDIAVGLSTSGNSDNLLRAFDEASRRGLLTIGFAGYQGGKMAEMDSIDYLFVAPSSSVHRIQEAQTTVYQILWELTLAELDRAGAVAR